MQKKVSKKGKDKKSSSESGSESESSKGVKQGSINKAEEGRELKRKKLKESP